MNDAFSGGDIQCTYRCSERLDCGFVGRRLVNRATCSRDARPHEGTHGSVSRRSATLYAH